MRSATASPDVRRAPLVAPAVLLLELRVLPDLGRDLAAEGLGLAAGRVALLDQRVAGLVGAAADAPASAAARRALRAAPPAAAAAAAPGAPRARPRRGPGPAGARPRGPLRIELARRRPQRRRLCSARSRAACSVASSPSRSSSAASASESGVGGGGAPCLSWAFSWQRRATSSSRAASSAVSSAASVPPATSASRRFSWSISSLYGRLGGGVRCSEVSWRALPPWSSRLRVCGVWCRSPRVGSVRGAPGAFVVFVAHKACCRKCASPIRQGRCQCALECLPWLDRVCASETGARCLFLCF